LELEADSRGPPPWKGARWTTTNLVDVEPPMGVRRDVKQAGGKSYPVERRDLAAAVLRIDRRREKPGTEGFRLSNSAPDIFCERRVDPRVRLAPPLVGTQ
jgi:hypothetical protein